MLYIVIVADLAVAVWLLWYARVRERRNRAGVAIVGVMLVVSAAVLAVIGATHASKPALRRPSPVSSPTGNTGQPA